MACPFQLHISYLLFLSHKFPRRTLNLATFDINLEKSTISLSEKTKVIATTTLEDKSFEYKAVNSIVDIDKDGNITPLKTGMEKIIVSHSSGYSKTLELKVTLPQSGDISIRNQNINTPPRPSKKSV